MQIRMEDLPINDLIQPSDFDNVEMAGSGIIPEAAEGETGLPKVAANWKREKSLKYDVRGRI